MKLPEPVKTGVRSLGREDVGMHLAVGRSYAKAANVVANLAGDIYQNIEEDRARNYLADSFVQLNEARARAETLPDATQAGDSYRVDIEDINEQAENNLDGLALKIWRERFNQKAESSHGDLVIRSAIKANRQQRELTKNNAMEMAYNGEDAIARGLVKEATMFSDEEKEVLLAQVAEKAELGQIERVGYSNEPELIESQLNYLNSTEYAGSLEGNQRISAIRFLENQYKTATKEQRNEELRQAEFAYSELIIDVRRGEAGPIQIDQAWDEGIIKTGAQRASLMAEYDRQQEEKQGAIDRNSLVLMSFNANQPLDPKNKTHQRAVNEYFAVNLGEGDAQELGVKLAIKTNILPEPMKANLRRMAIAGTPEQALNQANIYEVLQNQAPQTLDQIPDEIEAIYIVTSELNRGGVEIEEAVKIARDNALNKTPAQRQTYADQYQAHSDTPSDRLQEYIDDSMDTVWIMEPEITPGILSAWESLERNFYMYTGGNMEMASKAAAHNMSRIFSVSGINGKSQAFPYAPERVTGMPIEELQSQLKAFAHKHGAEEFMVSTDILTARDVGVKSYPFFKINEFGLPEIVEDENGNAVRWTPDVEAYHEKLLKEAKEKREAMDVYLEEGGIL